MGMVAERSLVRRKDVRLDGWGCSACGWVRPYPFTPTGVLEKREDLEAAFHLHRCEQSPMSKMVARESLN
jgi:hypothetical protein